MSQPKRYSFWPQIVHLPNGGGVKAEVHFKIEEDGLFVAHQDYAALAAEVERLQGNLAGRDAMIMGRDSIIKCRDEEIKRLNEEIDNLELYGRRDK